MDGATKAKGLEATYNQFLLYEHEMEDQMDHTGQGVDTPLKVANQAAFGVWYGQMTADKWRFVLVLIFNVVNDLGRQLSQVATYSLIQGGELATIGGLNTFLFASNPLSAAQ